MKKAIYVILSIILTVMVTISSISYKKYNHINLAMEYISKNTLKSGRFVYLNNLNPKVKYDSSIYNELRHAGTLYSMYLCEKINGNNKLKAKRLKASQYFTDNFVHEYKDGMRVVYEKKSKKNYTSLGGAGLALVALSNLYNEDPSYPEILDGLGKFIVFMQKPDGSFYHKFNVDNDKFIEKANVLYFPGEAAYGLLFLNEFSPDELWLNTAKKALLYIAKSRQNLGYNVPFDHWALLAIRKLFETENNNLTDEEYKILKKHAEQLANSVIRKQIRDVNSRFYGAFFKNTRLCSIGTIMEGLIAAYFCTDDVMLKRNIKLTVSLGLEFLSNYQVKFGPYKGAIPSDALWKTNKKKDYADIRIDNIQHVLSAWVTAKEMF